MWSALRSVSASSGPRRLGRYALTMRYRSPRVSSTACKNSSLAAARRSRASSGEAIIGSHLETYQDKQSGRFWSFRAGALV
jgi:hypothetical protein